MIEKMEGFNGRCKRQPKRVREFPGYAQTKENIEEFQVVLPMIQELSKESIRTRHWEKVLTMLNRMDVLGESQDIEAWLETVTFQELLDMELHKFEEEIIEVTDMADKELRIENDKADIVNKWEVEEFALRFSYCI